MIALLFISLTGLSLGSFVAIGIYSDTRTSLMLQKPTVEEAGTSILTGTIARFERRELGVASSPRRAVLESPKKKKNNPAPVATIPQNNFARWTNYKAKAPLFQEGLKVLGTLASLSKLKLSVEERHNIDVLSDQTNEMLSSFVNTPESIRNIPSVQDALLEQLDEIQKSVANIQSEGAERIVREAKIRTEFIKSKFNNPEG